MDSARVQAPAPLAPGSGPAGLLDLASMADAQSDAAPLSWGRRAAKALLREVGDLNFRLLLADAAVRLLPSMNFCLLRRTLYRLAGIRIGKGTTILGRMEFTETHRLQSQLEIGSRVIINKRFFADVTGPVRIGDGVSIGHHVVLVTAAHDLGPSGGRAGPGRALGIVIEDGCWIGARTTILPGVRIGTGSVVAAGSLVAADVPPNKLVGGVPARMIKSLPDAP